MPKRSPKKSSKALSRQHDRALESGAPPRPAAGTRCGPPAWAVAAILAIAISAVYGRALDAPFIFDDTSAILENKSIVSLWPLVGTADAPGPFKPPRDIPTGARPISNYSLALNYHFGGLNLMGYHATGVAIHFLTALLLWAIVRRTLLLPYFSGRFDSSAGWLALAVALLWALHPLQTEAVIYATQRTELLMAFFYLATVYCSLRYWSVPPLPRGEGWSEGALISADSPSIRRRRATWLVLALLACFAGMASKEVMVSAPLMILLFDRCFISGSLIAALRRSWPLYAGLASTWALLLLLVLSDPHSASAGFSYDVPPHFWWLTQTKVLWLYLKLIVWPSPLLIHYQLPILTTFADSWMYVVPVLLAAIATLVLLWRNNPVGLLVTWAAALLSPTFVVPILTEMAAERRMYLPLAPIVIVLVVGAYMFAAWAMRRQASKTQGMAVSSPSLAIVGIPTFLLAAVFGLVSAKRLVAYDDEYGLWQEVLQLQPKNSVAHQNLAFYLDKKGRFPTAIEHYREAVRLSPQSVMALYNLGVLLIKTEVPREAIPVFQQGLVVAPNNITLRNNLAVALFMSGRNSEAFAACRAALEVDPNNWSAHNNLGMIQQKAHLYPESIESFETALRLNPKALDIYNELANTYSLQNQREKAIATLEHGLERARSAGDTENVKRFTERLEANR